MWFEERSWSNLKLTDDLIEDWRDLWAFKIDFTLVTLAYVWAASSFLDLPNKILTNGGLAFVVAYGAALVLVCLPIIVLELSMGQLTGRAPVQAFASLSPIFKGVGVSQLLFSFITLVMSCRFLGILYEFIYYIGWAASRGLPSLPWISCNYTQIHSTLCRESAKLFVSSKPIETANTSSMAEFMDHLSRPSSSIQTIGWFELTPVIAIAVVWAFVFITIAFGVRWMGKMVPLYLFLAASSTLAIFVRALLLGDISYGFIYFYNKTNWEVLQDYRVWLEAAKEALLGTGCGFGAYITLASYCKRSNNLVKDSFIILKGHAIFASVQVSLVILLSGYICRRHGYEFDMVITGGKEQMWYALVYLFEFGHLKIWTLCLLVSVAFSLISILCVLAMSLLAGLEDAIGEGASRCCPRFTLAFFLCLAGFGTSFIFTFHGGHWIHLLLEQYTSIATLWIILAAELIVAGYFYCAHRLGNDLHVMLRHACCWCLGHFILLFNYILFVVPIAIAVHSIMNYSTDAIPQQIKDWHWYEVAGFASAAVALLPIPWYMLCALCRVCCCSGKDDGGKCTQLFCTTLRASSVEEGNDYHARYHAHNASSMSRNSDIAPPRYAAAAPGYLRLPQAPLAEPETYNEVR